VINDKPFRFSVNYYPIGMERTDDVWAIISAADKDYEKMVEVFYQAGSHIKAIVPLPDNNGHMRPI
jgi:predicted phosphoadenosine phosphosulfate sulfurtransferase